MPYFKGRKVSNEEWHRLRGSQPVGWKEATGWKDGDDVPAPATSEAPEPEKPKRKPRSNKTQAKSALEQITGLDITLAGEEE